jgi:hypothetical protein
VGSECKKRLLPLGKVIIFLSSDWKHEGDLKKSECKEDKRDNIYKKTIKHRIYKLWEIYNRIVKPMNAKVVSMNIQDDLNNCIEEEIQQNNQYDLCLVCPSHSGEGKGDREVTVTWSEGSPYDPQYRRDDMKRVLKQCSRISKRIHICSCDTGERLEYICPENTVISGYVGDCKIEEFTISYVVARCPTSRTSIQRVRPKLVGPTLKIYPDENTD